MTLLLCFLASAQITDADRAWWAYQPLRTTASPTARQIDRLLPGGPSAEPRALLRRLAFDLTGLPPTAEELDLFAADPSPKAWAAAVESLLASPRYGEHSARRWLDLVRYAESDGFKADAYRPHTWHYRDWVISAFNNDKPYDRFIQEQIAGDELFPGDLEARAATTYLRLGIYEYNQRNAKGHWSDILNDLTDVTADVFLAMGAGCARCHNHKFDPILQTDYYKLRAFFEPLFWRDDLALATADQIEESRRAAAEWEGKTAELRRQIFEIEEPHRARAGQEVLNKFIDEYQVMLKKTPGERGPLERQMVYLMERQYVEEGGKYADRIKGEERARWEALRKELATFDAIKPAAIPTAFAATDVGPAAPPTTIPDRGITVEPGFPEVLGAPSPVVAPLPDSTGRRAALARWLSSPENPLTARVMVNRIWQGLFGRGLVATPSDFGRLGEQPSHPELLDWLSAEFIRSGWSVKHVVRLIVTSEAYRARRAPRRLEAEQIRDALLAASGELDTKVGGASVDAGSKRRSVYTKIQRNSPDPLLAAFDAPDGLNSTGNRSSTTTAPQALMLINSPWPLERAKAMARRVKATGSADPAQRAALAYRLAFGRAPTEPEAAAAADFLGGGGKPDERLVDFCHALLNSNEFVYVD